MAKRKHRKQRRVDKIARAGNKFGSRLASGISSSGPKLMKKLF
jgi:hypothetical protein